ncbi:MAG: hypothetical protein HDT43_00690 [Ruminococcaceae bacterium]|nr:hypothetical protein [Oscillospiraceae bacterium]
MKTLEFKPSSGSGISAAKPLFDRLADELGSEWEYTFDDDGKTARFTHGEMFFEFAPTANSSAETIKVGNSKTTYTALSQVWNIGSGYSFIDILEAEDRGTVALGFRTDVTNETSYGFNVIWGKYEDGSEYIIWGMVNTNTAESPATLLDDTATASRMFPNVLESVGAPWCFGKQPKTNLAVLPKSLYFAQSVPNRVHYIELLHGDKKYVGFSTLKAGANNTVTTKPSMFAVPVKSFDIEHIHI